MCFPMSSASHQQQPNPIDRVLFHEFTNCHPRRRQSAMRTVKLEIGQLAVLVALRNAGGGEQRLGALLKAAIATYDTAVGPLSDRTPAGAFALGANFHSYFHTIDFASSGGSSQVQKAGCLCRCCGERRKRRSPVFAGRVRTEGFLSSRVFDHLQEDAGLGAQGTAAGMNYVKT